ncbi:MAG: hypothetical protein ABIN95_08515 [Mucilaginibacter sp.]
MYSVYNNRNIATLYMIRHGWLKPEYELTDNVHSYGRLTYKWISAKRRAFVEMADRTIGFRFEGFWKTSLVITDSNEDIIGKLTMKPFKRRSILEMNSGFKATFRRVSFWKSQYVWESDMYGPIVRIHSPSFSSTDNILIEQSTAPVDVLPLLAFLGLHLIIIRRQREAAIASS